MNRHKLVLGVTLALLTVASGCGTNTPMETMEPQGATMPEAMAPEHQDDSSALDLGDTNTYAVQQLGGRGWFVSPFSVRQYYSNYLIRRRCRLLWIPGRFIIRDRARIWVRGHFIVVCFRPFPRPYPTVRPTVRPSPYPTATPTMRPSPYPTATPTMRPSPYPTATPTPYPTPTPTPYPTPTPTPY
jgi:hypothetical protein